MFIWLNLTSHKLTEAVEVLGEMYVKIILNIYIILTTASHCYKSGTVNDIYI